MTFTAPQTLKMDTLPSELLTLILTHLPKSTLPAIRLTSHIFATLAFPFLFSHLSNWLDYDISHQSIISLAHDAYNRPAVMWSPWAAGLDGPVDDVFLRVVWRLLVKSPVPSESLSFSTVNEGKKLGEDLDIDLEEEEDRKRGSEREGIRLTANNFAELSGRKEMTENRLRTGQNRFLLHRTCMEEARDEGSWGSFD